MQSVAVTDKNTLGLNNCAVGISESNEMEDFGPIVSAPPAKLRSYISVTDTVASSSNVKSSFLTGSSENNLNGLASMLGSAPVMKGKFRNDTTLNPRKFLIYREVLINCFFSRKKEHFGHPCLVWKCVKIV